MSAERFPHQERDLLPFHIHVEVGVAGGDARDQLRHRSVDRLSQESAWVGISQDVGTVHLDLRSDRAPRQKNTRGPDTGRISHRRDVATDDDKQVEVVLELHVPQLPLDPTQLFEVGQRYRRAAEHRSEPEPMRHPATPIEGSLTVRSDGARVDSTVRRGDLPVQVGWPDQDEWVDPLGNDLDDDVLEFLS